MLLTLSCYLGLIWQFFYLDILKPDLVAVILQEDEPLFRVTKIRPIFVLTLLYDLVPLIGVAFVLHDLNSIQPVLHVVPLHHDHRGIKEPVAERFIFRGRDQVVKRPKCSVSIPTHFGIGVPSIVQYLEFTTDGRSLTVFIQIGIHEVLDAAISSFRDPEIHFQHKVLVGTGGHDISAVSRFTAVALMYLKDTLINGPSFFRESV